MRCDPEQANGRFASERATLRTTCRVMAEGMRSVSIWSRGSIHAERGKVHAHQVQLNDPLHTNATENLNVWPAQSMIAPGNTTVLQTGVKQPASVFCDIGFGLCDAVMPCACACALQLGLPSPEGIQARGRSPSDKLYMSRWSV